LVLNKLNDEVKNYDVAVLFLFSKDESDTTNAAWDRLLENGWFKKILKVAVACGNRTTLHEFAKKFTGNPETVLDIENCEVIKKMLRPFDFSYEAMGGCVEPDGDSPWETTVYTEENHPGKEKCNTLREIRQKIAEMNGIDFKPAECHHSGPCAGTCPVCDDEIKYLDL